MRADTLIRIDTSGTRAKLEVVDGEAEIGGHQLGSVMLLGNFDGLHRGHRSLVDAGRDLARRLGAPLGIMSCEPHPRQFFRPDEAPFRLTTRTGKRLMFCELGFDILFEPRFDAAFASLSPGDFVRDILVDYLRVRAVVVGRDFWFGHRRSGSVEDLAAFGRAFGFEVLIVSDVMMESERLSSTRIRQWLHEGRLRRVSESFGSRWMTCVSLDEEGIARFDASQALPPAGAYQVEIMDAAGVSMGHEILELQGGRHGRLSGTRLSRPGRHLIGNWASTNAF